MFAVVFLCVGAIFALELWRRHVVRTRQVPRWTTLVTWGFFGIAAALGGVTVWMLQRARNAVEGYAPEAAVRLAESISYAMNANAVSVVALGCATILLGVSQMIRPRR